jgi:DNA-binding NarL/FixJ family response regulator
VISLLLVDDQALIRAGLKHVLTAADGFTIVAEAADGAEALSALGRHDVDVVLMDIRMRGMDGIEATRCICGRDNPPPVLILTTFDDDEALIGALEAGAAGFALKETTADELIRAVEVVAAGGAWLDPVVTPRVLDVYRRQAAAANAARAALDELTEREHEVLVHMANGATNAEIAESLIVSMATVKTHVGSIFSKLGARDRAAAIIHAHRHGLVT